MRRRLAQIVSSRNSPRNSRSPSLSFLVLVLTSAEEARRQRKDASPFSLLASYSMGSAAITPRRRTWLAVRGFKRSHGRGFRERPWTSKDARAAILACRVPGPALIFASVTTFIEGALTEHRQVIIVTHNANIAVLGDAELILPLRGASEISIVRDRGSIDTELTKQMVCTILEGSPKAFKRRREMYGF